MSAPRALASEIAARRAFREGVRREHHAAEHSAGASSPGAKQSLEAACKSALPGDLIVVSWPGTALPPRDVLCALKRASATCHGVPFILEGVAADDLPPSVARSMGPGWLTTNLADQSCSVGSILKLPGLGAHHFGVDLQPHASLADEAVIDLLAAPDAGPTLAEIARTLDASPSAVAHSLSRQVGVRWSDLRHRRMTALALLIRYLTGTPPSRLATALKLNVRNTRSLARRCAAIAPAEGLAAIRRLLRSGHRPQAAHDGMSTER